MIHDMLGSNIRTYCCVYSFHAFLGIALYFDLTMAPRFLHIWASPYHHPDGTMLLAHLGIALSPSGFAHECHLTGHRPRRERVSSIISFSNNHILLCNLLLLFAGHRPITSHKSGHRPITNQICICISNTYLGATYILYFFGNLIICQWSVPLCM